MKISQLLLFVLHVVEGCQWSIEAEDVINDEITNFNGTLTPQPRSRASNKQTVRLDEGQYITWTITTDSTCFLQVLNVQYTNDGLSDTVTIYVDDRMVGFFKTRSQSVATDISGMNPLVQIRLEMKPCYQRETTPSNWLLPRLTSIWWKLTK